MNDNMVLLGAGGRIVIPATIRKAMRLSAGDRLIISYTDGVLRIMTPRQAAELAQSMIRPHVAKNRSLSEELIAERRKEDRDE